MFEAVFFNATQTLIVLFLSLLSLIAVVGVIWARIRQ
jgi:hypothetical protein